MADNLSCKKTFCSIPWKEPFVTSHGHYDLCALEIEVASKQKTYIDKDLQQYWNSDDLKQIRKKMLDGITPAECEICHNDEKNGCVSQRQRRNMKYIKSYEPSLENKIFQGLLENTNQDGSVKNLQISGIHFAVGKICQLGCVSCSSFNSSFLAQEEKKHPHLKIYKDRHNRTDLHKQMPQKDIDSDLYSLLKNNIEKIEHIHATGGEPFLSKNFFEFIDWCVKNNHTKKKLYIQTNGVTFIKEEHIKNLQKFNEIQLFISCDATGELEEYVRYPTEWKNKIKCINFYRDYFQDITLNATMHALNVVGVASLIEFAEKNNLKLWLNFLSEPKFLQIKNTDVEIKHKTLAYLSALQDYDSKISPWLKSQLITIYNKINQQKDSPENENLSKMIKLYKQVRKKDYFKLLTKY